MKQPNLALSRRGLLTSAAIALPVIALAPMLLSGCSSENADVAKTASAGFLDAVADIVIPATNTPGAKAVKVGDYMDRAFQHGLFGGDANTAGALEEVLGQRVPGGAFMKGSPAQRLAAVTALDKETFSRPTAVVAPSALQIGTSPAGSIAAPTEPEPNRLWRIAKNAIMVGYYMSEVGASQELRYELVPGRFDPDIPYKPGDKYLSNNWMANNG